MKKEPKQKVTKKAVRTRAQLLETALKLFTNRGFDQTTMRDVAESCGLSVGSTYYYFKTKEELVLAFYIESCTTFSERSEQILAESKIFKERLSRVLDERLNQLRPYRSFLGALMSSAIDPRSAISPFSAETKTIRDGAIMVFERVITGSNQKVPARLKQHLALLLWLYHLGIVLFWTFDDSPEQKKTRRLIEGTIGFMVAGLKISNLPLMGTMLKPVLDLLDDIFPAASQPACKT